MSKKRDYTDEDVGIFCDDKGATHLDINIFVDFVLSRHKLVVTDSGDFYCYKDGCWRKKQVCEIRQMLLFYYLPFASFLYSKHLESEYMELLKLKAYNKDVRFNTNRRYLNLANGILDINRCKLIKHTYKLYSTVQIPIAYDPKADCPTFKKFLDSTFEGDAERIAVIQELLGYCLTPSMKAQCFFIFLGAGSNGKSILCQVFRWLVGEGNYTALPISELSQRFPRASLENKLLNVSAENETPRGRYLDSQDVKAITGGDEIKAEFKGKDVFTFRPICKMIFAVNTVPNFNDRSHGLLRRMKIVPFNVIFRTEDGTADIDLDKKLKKELPGILNFAIEGLIRLRKNKFQFTKSEVMDKALEDYEQLIDPYVEFIDGYVIFEGRSTRKEVYNTFLNWARVTNHKIMSEVTPKRFWADFRAACEKKGYVIKDIKSSERFVNISLKSEACKELRGGNSRVGYFN